MHRPRFPLHRSLLFWAGVMVMGFTVWGWWQSEREVKSVGYRDWMMVNFESRVSVGRVRQGERGWNEPMGWAAGAIAPGPMRFRAPRLLRHLGGEFGSDERPVRISGRDHFEDAYMDESLLLLGEKGDWLCQVPHWLILVGAAVPWAGGLAW